MNKTIIAGDFNSNTIWDEWDRWWNHTDVVNELKELGIESLYHTFTGEKQGAETNPTLYFQRKLDRPYHIDYVFGSDIFSKSLKYFTVGYAETSKIIIKSFQKSGQHGNLLARS